MSQNDTFSRGINVTMQLEIDFFTFSIEKLTVYLILSQTPNQ